MFRFRKLDAHPSPQITIISLFPAVAVFQTIMWIGNQDVSLVSFTIMKIVSLMCSSLERNTSGQIVVLFFLLERRHLTFQVWSFFNTNSLVIIIELIWFEIFSSTNLSYVQLVFGIDKCSSTMLEIYYLFTILQVSMLMAFRLTPQRTAVSLIDTKTHPLARF